MATSVSATSLGSIGDQAFNRMPKVNGELLTLTYGSIVTQLLRDYEDAIEVNGQLETMGYNIGIRLIDELLSKTGIRKCQGFTESMEVCAKVGFKMFLGISPEVTDWNQEKNMCSLQFSKESNPLEDFVELPDDLRSNLHYSNILIGVIKGAFDSLSMKVKASFIRDVLKGDTVTEIRVQLVEVMEELAGDDYAEE